MALSIYEVVKGISQAVHNVHHGAIDESGKKIEIGLKREDQPIKDQKVIDGFGVSLHGNMLILRYNSHEPLSNLHEKRFEKEMERRIQDIRTFIQKQFLKNTGVNLRLKEAEDVKIIVESGNRIKAMIKAMMAYEILNLKDKVDLIGCQSCTDKLEEIEAKNKAMMRKVVKPRNVTRKEK